MATDIETLILGGGPAGLSCGMELCRAGKRFAVVEKESQVGGLAKTLQLGDFRTDIGPHRFYSKNRYLYEFIEDLLGEQWIQVQRFTRFYVQGKFYAYPVRLTNALKNMGLASATRVLRDYSLEQFRNLVGLGRRDTDFESYVVSRFGRELAHFNMINYTEKIWGIPCHQISADWASQRISGLSLFSAVRAALTQSKGPRSLVDAFYYPDRGTGLIYEAIRKRLEAAGNDVLLNAVPIKIRHAGDTISQVDVRRDRETVTYQPSYLVNSTPILRFLRLFDPLPPDAVLAAAGRLHYRAQVYLFLTIGKERAIPDNWIYFPDKEIPFGRISEMKNFSKKMSPQGRTSLLLEFFVFEGDATWTMRKEELLHRCLPHLEGIGLVDRREIIDTYLFRQPDVYPIYRLGYQEALGTIKSWLDRFENLFYIGRPGRFRYNNQDHSIEMGILAARSIIENKRYDMEAIAAKDEYFEKGALPYRRSFQHQVIEDRGA